MIEKDREKVLREGIEEGYYPRYLYKYWPYKSAIRFLTNLQIKYSCCREFNDPFEGRYGLIGNSSREEKNRFLLSFLKNISISECDMISDDEIKQMMDKIICESIENVGVFCLSEKNDNMLMWAHYAHEHEGVCLKFDLLSDTAAFSSLHKVIYSTEYLNFNVMTETSLINKILVHKSVDWMYEREYRVMKMGEVGLKKNINPHALVEIAFGCRMSLPNRQEIKELVSSNPSLNVQFKLAARDRNDYRILFIDENDPRTIRD